jgi:thiol-disulfide isomerase/thioredoxin
MTRVLLALPLLLIFLATIAKADQASLPGCEPPSAIQKIIKDQLHSPEFWRLDYSARLARNRQILVDLMKRYPREVEPFNLWIATVREDQLLHPELLAGLQRTYREQAAAHPNDPLALYLAAAALRSTGTPESIRLLDQAQTLSPSFAWPALELAQIYSSGKFAGKTKFTDQLTKFWTACPTSQDQQARWMLVKVPDLQKQVAKAERASLAKTSDPDRLMDYEFLWGLEFRTTSPKDFPQLREQVGEDVKRLESVTNPHPDADWATLLLHGSQQAGATPGSIRAQEDAIIAKYPHSGSAQGIVWKRWKDAHPEPADGKDVAGCKSYNVAVQALKLSWIQQFPDATYPPDNWRFFAMQDDESVAESQGVALADKFVNAISSHDPPFILKYDYYQAANYLLDRRWASAKALEYLHQAKQWQQRTDSDYLAQDDHSEADLKEHGKNVQDMDRYFDGQILLAALRAHRPDAITPVLKAAVEAPRAADDKDESAYWLRRARLAAIEGQQQDALGYYQLALRNRAKPPSYQRGKLEDNLSDEAHTLWTKLGGTEVTWAAWSQPASPTDAAKADDARWEKPTKTLPTFELADLSGKTWSAKSLNGKVVLINLWATWCGPCNAELPQLQKLYQQAKGRSDIQILTFNIDEDLGLVEPFMKEKGYTFPVVPAYSYVVNLLDGYAIPQNWVLNPKGQWEWTQIGYGSDDAWVKDMLAKLDAVKSGS